MRAFDKLKRDLSKHRGRAALLGVLFVTMLVMGIRAVLELRPRGAAAAVDTTAGLPPTPGLTGDPELNGARAQELIEDSRKLWTALRSVKPNAAEPKAAFAFDPSYYPTPAPIVDLNKATPGPEVVVSPPPPATAPENMNDRIKRVRDLAQKLVVKSTAVGNGVTQPMAIVNQQVVTVGQTILGFEVTAIRSREVEFVKEGVTIVGKMPDGL